jgi:hypothetical protein
LGLGATVTSIIFLAAILLTVIFLSVSKLDLTAKNNAKIKANTVNKNRSAVLLQVVAVVCVMTIVSGTGYYWRHTSLIAEAKTSSLQNATPGKTTGSSSQTSSSDDYSSFKTIEKDTLNFVEKGDMSAAKSRVNDLEYTWDNSQAQLKPKDPAKWTEIDNTIDDVLKQVRSVNPDTAACKSAIESSLAALS